MANTADCFAIVKTIWQKKATADCQEH